VQRLRTEPLLNPDYRAGRFTSIRVAARWARENAVRWKSERAAQPTDEKAARDEDAKAAQAGTQGALLLWPVDCPGVTASTLSRLCRESIAHPECNIVPIFGDRGGHPVILCARFLEIILSTGEDGNLRELMRHDQVSRRTCPVEDPAVLDNLNGPKEYEEFLQCRPAMWEDRPSDGEAKRISRP